MEQIRAKERYQMRQIKHSQENVKVKNEAIAKMGQNQIDSMKDVLKQDGQQIGSMVKKLNGFKNDLVAS